ncbi:PLP-dependent aspartate aminotransferase family protein [bacterium]|nr:PLP-dependent aspartate aminotransferase family protein [bacterium]
MSKEIQGHLETLAVHAGVTPDPTTGAIMTPIYATSTYVQSSPGQHRGYEYSRTKNPTRTALEESIAALEGGRHGFATASGCAAMDILMHLLNTGEHVVCVDDVYGGSSRLLRMVWARHGVDVTFADLVNKPISDFVKPNTRMIWIETPTNPMLKVIDIEAISKWASKQNPKPIVVVDNTFATPIFQSPLALGADVVLHSTSKYLNGHSDLVGGAIVTDKDELADRIHYLQNAAGGVAGAFDSWLVLRGIKTLALRMQRHNENGHEIAGWLEKHPRVDKVIYTGLPSHPQADVARRQMRGAGGMITFFLKGGLAEARKFLETVRVFSLAESLGGVESLVDHPAIMTHASIPAETRKQLGISDNLIRLSVGVEHVEDLRKDLEAALSASAR